MIITINKSNEQVSNRRRKLQSNKQTNTLPKLNKSKSPYVGRLSRQDLSVPGIKAPQGFRVLSAPQALWVYAQPLMYIIPAPEDVSKANEIFDVIKTIWNVKTDRLPVPQEKSDQEIVAMIQERLGLDKNRAKNFFSMMLQRKESLFPNFIQPKGAPFLYIRKERSYFINRFDYESLELNDDSIPPDELDLEFVENLQKLDQHILVPANYHKYKELLLKVQEQCSQRFGIWLSNKGIKKQERFSFFADVFVSFIYAYRHRAPITLQSRPDDYLIEFMAAHVFRRTSIEPREYALCPSAIRFLYKFLHEKGYLVHPPEPIISYIDRLEPFFLDILREKFS